jgi:carboxyl-terminal processing protease
MNRSRVVFLLLSSLLVVPILAGTILRASQDKEAAGEDSLYKYLSVFSEVLGLVRQAYVDEPDTAVLMSGALDGTTEALDAFSFYVPADEVAAYQEAQRVGMRHSGLALVKERGIAFVVAVENGSPAATAGVEVSDVVAKIDGRSTRVMPVWEIHERLARRPGTRMTMEVIRLSEPVELTLELKPFEPPPARIEQAAGSPEVSILRIPSFDAETATEVRQALDRLRGRAGADRLLVDLRGVSSGNSEAAYATAELFATGDLGALAGRSGEVATFTGRRAPLWQGKTVVLVDRGTLGAAEIFAAVLRQKAGADLVGERTFGHAGRQGVAELSSGGRLFFTEAFYTGPDRKPINESIRPDLVVDERSRTFLEKDVPIGELILKRGIDRLLGREEPAEAAKKAA